jgi:hypothetical protein
MHEAIRKIAGDYNIPFGLKEGRLLQLLGTEWGRACKGKDVWVNACRSQVNLCREPKSWVIIDDMRFRNEFHAFSGADVVRIRLVAPTEVRRIRCSAWRATDTHPSETDLDDPSLPWDLVLDTAAMDAKATADAAIAYIMER